VNVLLLNDNGHNAPFGKLTRSIKVSSAGA